MHDHMGNFDKTTIDRVNCPELQQADNDYAVGRLVDKVDHSRYKSDTLILIVEDDAQDGADHVDAHRSTTYVVGPYVRQKTVVTQHYTTVNLLRTIEDSLGLQHLSIYTATQPPMTEVFDLSKREWAYDAAKHWTGQLNQAFDAQKMSWSRIVLNPWLVVQSFQDPHV